MRNPPEGEVGFWGRIRRDVPGPLAARGGEWELIAEKTNTPENIEAWKKYINTKEYPQYDSIVVSAKRPKFVAFKWPGRNPPRSADPSAFDARLADWIGAMQEKIDTEYASQYKNVKPPILEIEQGPRYVRIIKADAEGTSRSAFVFIDKNTGDILKPAGWKGPAKHARGNIFDAKGGLGWMGAYGAAHIRNNPGRTTMVKYARLEPSHDAMILKYAPHAGWMDVVIYDDRVARHHYATFPATHTKSKPRRGQKSAIINGVKWELRWLPSLKRRSKVEARLRGRNPRRGRHARRGRARNPRRRFMRNPLNQRKWATYYGGSGYAGGRFSAYDIHTDRGEYHIWPPNRRFGSYTLQFADTKGFGSGGLWHDLGKFCSPQAAKAAASRHYDGLVVQGPERVGINSRKRR